MSVFDPLRSRYRNGVILMDGGMGQELIHRGMDASHVLWSTHALMTNPDLIRQVHVDFCAAGAQIIITSNYSTTPYRLELENAADQMPALIVQACDIALQAREEASEDDILIAGCLPPLYGSYRVENIRSLAEHVDGYRRIVEHEAGRVDFLLAETLTSGLEGRAAAIVAQEFDLPIVIAWTLMDDQSRLLRSGESITEAVAACEGLPVEAWLANCSWPEALTAAMPVLAGEDKPFGGYANGFTRIPQGWNLQKGDTLPAARTDLDPQAYAAHVAQWIADGATLVGGCCEVGPAHIAAIRDMLTD